MTDELHEFLKSKGVEFCYSGVEPYVVYDRVDVNYVQEFHDQQMAKKKKELPEAILKWLEGMVT